METETRLQADDPDRIVRMGPRKRDRWTYVVDRYNGDRWRLDGTTLDLEFDPTGPNSTDRRGAWVLYDGDQYIEPIGRFLEGYCDAMDWIERAVDGRHDWSDHLGRPEMPEWLANARIAVRVWRLTVGTE